MNIENEADYVGFGSIQISVPFQINGGDCLVLHANLIGVEAGDFLGISGSSNEERLLNKKTDEENNVFSSSGL
ncbi:hypothetical protein H9649_10925 [Sporosarcina sp. Sa2YVA2]|uniref:Uncharacterized protein n=1 Tax=Sporosarcina quadrami TaxID=2762234 RepID=A0ABR8UAR2_9BACL|nr:hypothetical protein [Sporosarcina quadrami]MBD7985101.1 hypothetical protein [Sporosarcina quadrami]